MNELGNGENFLVNLEKRLSGIENRVDRGFGSVKSDLVRVSDRLEFHHRTQQQLLDVMRDDVSKIDSRVVKIEDVNPTELANRVGKIENGLSWVNRTLAGAAVTIIVLVIVALATKGFGAG